MASTTFTWTPDWNGSLSEEPRIKSAAFGDGYRQDVGDGINIRPRVWSLTFNTRTDAEIAPILAFLRARNGIEAFNWTDPDGTAGVFKCKKWQRVPVRTGINNLSCTFSEVFGE